MDGIAQRCLCSESSPTSAPTSSRSPWRSSLHLEHSRKLLTAASQPHSAGAWPAPLLPHDVPSYGSDAGPPGQATVLDGRAVAAAWQAELAVEVAELSRTLGRPPGLGVLLVGDRPDSLLYVTRKKLACHEVSPR